MRNSSIYFIIIAVLGLFSCKQTQPVAEKKKTEITAIDLMDPLTKQRVKRIYVDACTELMRGDNASAQELFEEVLSADPNNHAAMFNISKILIDQRKFDEAIRYGKTALEKEKNNFWYYKNLQRAYEYNGDYNNTISIQEEIASRFPTMTEEKLKLAELYLRSNQAEKSIVVLDEIEKEKGPNSELLIRKFRILSSQKKYDEALALAERLINLNPEEARFYRYKVETLQNLNRKEETVSLLEEILEKDPNNGFALLSLADYYKSQSQLEKSDEYLYRAFQNPGIDPEGKIIIIQGLMNYIGREPHILPRIKKLANIFNQTHPGSSQTYGIQGKLLFLEGKVDSARIYFRQAVDADPTNTESWLDLLETSLEPKYFDRLFKDSEEALEYYPNQERFLFFHGISGSYLEKYRPAVHALEKIKKMEPSDNDMLAQTYAELGKIYHKQAKYEDSDANYVKAIELKPDDAFVLNNYAYYLSLRNDRLVDAQKYIEKALDIRPNQTSFQDTYGWILYQQEKYTEAEKWLKKAADQSNSAVILEHYGDVLLKLGKKDEAINQWKKAIEGGARGIDIEKKLGER